MDRGRLFLKSRHSNSSSLRRPKKQRRSSTLKVNSQPTIFRDSISAKASPVLPVLTISSECWDKLNPAVYITNSVNLNPSHVGFSKVHSIHDEVSSSCPFSYTELPIKCDGISSVLCVTLSANPLDMFPRPDTILKQARESLIAMVHPTKALFIKYTHEFLCQYSKRSNPLGFSRNNQIRGSYGICPSVNIVEINERKYDFEELLPPRLSGPRNIRFNQEYLRVSLAETKMMKANKILRPLKQRQYLPRRDDIYSANRPSSLSNCFSNSSEISQPSTRYDTSVC